ncbi:MAG: hypothetical protein RSB26_07675 [Lachnospiraceae bacterium]
MSGENRTINIPWFKKGDVDATIGVFFDGFSKIIVGVGVLTGVMGMAQEIVFGKIVSAIGLTAFLLLAFNTFYARRLGKKLGRDDITALPAGIAAGSFFAWLFAIFMPVFFSSGDAIFAWKVTLHANMLYGIMFVVCGFVIKLLMKYIPMEAMLGSVVGGSIAYLLMASMADGFSHPQIQLPALFLLLFFQFGKVKTKRLSPALIAVLVGTIIGWVTGVMKLGDLTSAFQTIGIYVPLPQIGLLGGEALRQASTFLPLVIAYAFADVTALLQGLEQAARGGDCYDERTCLIATGCANIIGSLFGNPFPMNEYWGHPAWKKVKAGTSYSLFTGIIYLVLCMSGLVAIATSAIPAGATLILLIFVAISTGTQSYSSVNKKYYPAMIVATAIPVFELLYSKVLNGATAATTAIGEALQAGGIDFAVDSVKMTSEHLATAGVAQGYFFLGKGSMMIAILYACAVIFIIDRKWLNTSVTFIVAAVCSFIGLIHSEKVMINANTTFTIIYGIIAIFFLIVYLISKNNVELQPTEAHTPCGEE